MNHERQMLMITYSLSTLSFLTYRKNMDHTVVTSSNKELCGDDTQCAFIAPSRFTQLIPEKSSPFLSIMFLLT